MKLEGKIAVITGADSGIGQALMANIPWRRPGEPSEIGELVLFLAADTGDYVTGQTWTMDGGLTMNWGSA